MIGNVASNEAACMAVAASRPGARKTRYDTPPSAGTAELETYDPRPRPIAVRKRAGDRNDEKIDARNVRRYCRKRCSNTRPAVEFVNVREVTQRPTRSGTGRSGAGRRPQATTD